MESIEQQLKDLIQDQLHVDIDQITGDKKFIDDLGVDSLDAVELAMACEDTFDIIVNDEDCEKCETVDHAIELITRLCKEAGHE